MKGFEDQFRVCIGSVWKENLSAKLNEAGNDACQAMLQRERQRERSH
jgi:hypothetical protein